MGGLNSQLNAHFVRSAVATICAGSVVGMIVSAVTHHLGGVITLGCISTAAIITLIAVVAVGDGARPTTAREPVDTRQAERVEGLVEALTRDGADEQALRDLVGEAVRLGRGRLG